MKRFILLLLVLLNLEFLWAAEVKYKNVEQVTVFVNKVGPYSNPQETYHYFQLPVCRPSQVVHKRLSLGEVLDGDRMAESLYVIKFKEALTKQALCSPINLTAKEREILESAIEENYYFEFVIDDLPIRQFVGRLDEQGIFPHEHKIFLYTHHHFIIEYNEQNIISAVIDVHKEAPMRLDDIGASELSIPYTYSVEWKETSVKYSERHKVSGDASFFPKSLEIHWLSVINSSLLVFLLIGFVILILVRIVRSDLMRYNSDDEDKDMEMLDNGWKVLHADVFRFPVYRNVFCACLEPSPVGAIRLAVDICQPIELHRRLLLRLLYGVGCQLLLITGLILLIGSFNIINVHRHGLINVLVVLLYAFTSSVAGYVSASKYKQLGGIHWVWNINLTSSLFSMPAFITWCVLNSFSWAYQSTQALPYGTIILLMIVWLCIGYPLTVVGGIIGKNYGDRYEAPCRTRNIPRELPALPWYHSPLTFGVIGGFLPFSAISVELYYIFSTVWGHDSYTLFGILLIVFLILLSVTACVSVALTYFQLAAEDYHWWWRSLLVGGSTGLFVLAYSIFFYLRRSDMNGVLQSVQFFGTVVIVCYAFFLSLGTVAFFASQRFVKFIYGSVKTD